MSNTLFGFISVYGLLIAIAIALGVVYCQCQTKRLGLPEDIGIDFALWVVPAALIGARLYYCIFAWDLYASNPISVLYVWEGGLAIYGGVIGGALGAWLLSRHRHVSFWKLADMVAPALILGQAIGRWGNFFNGECYGELVTNPTWQFFPASVLIGTQWHMATFFYESMWDLAGFIVLHLCRKRVTVQGNLFFGYLCWYGAGRAVIEGLRTDSLMWGSVRVSQALSFLLFIAAGTVLLVRHVRLRGKSAQVKE